ncbi:uncharacterized protein LOC128891606 [Hylaeus anthracinus]|uniref:uncharacterized protein LOC128881295 n=1 Tax=Hylaeus volcanicus TaxID=313075 RepID=UPI0023B8653C|nr:uncharacterized protein LOC128881295 [Hylaeus volcanicus]XP_054007200.1 uncharacterized protein LOC128891606 [Hylaeus anthracinus]
MSGSKIVFRRADGTKETATELLHEFGTTDVAIGDVTAEVMITTLGKIPNEMYDLDETSPKMKYATPRIDLQSTSRYVQAMMSTDETINANGRSEGHSSVLVALLSALVVILFMCCITACLIARSKRRRNFFGKSDTECEPGCTGINQPLLDKISQSTNKTSNGSSRD